MSVLLLGARWLKRKVERWRWAAYSAMAANSGRSVDEALSKEDLPNIVDELSPVAHKYKMIGIRLSQVELNDIKNIEADCSGTKVRLLEVISFRLQKLPELTWKEIYRALKSPSVGESRIAEGIQTKFGHSSSDGARYESHEYEKSNKECKRKADIGDHSTLHLGKSRGDHSMTMKAKIYEDGVEDSLPETIKETEKIPKVRENALAVPCIGQHKVPIEKETLYESHQSELYEFDEGKEKGKRIKEMEDYARSDNNVSTRSSRQKIKRKEVENESSDEISEEETESPSFEREKSDKPKKLGKRRKLVQKESTDYQSVVATSGDQGQYSDREVSNTDYTSIEFESQSQSSEEDYKTPEPKRISTSKLEFCLKNEAVKGKRKLKAHRRSTIVGDSQWEKDKITKQEDVATKQISFTSEEVSSYDYSDTEKNILDKVAIKLTERQKFDMEQRQPNTQARKKKRVRELSDSPSTSPSSSPVSKLSQSRGTKHHEYSMGKKEKRQEISSSSESDEDTLPPECNAVKRLTEHKKIALV